MKNQRPVNLNLFTIRQPIPAIASILHRISGLILFILIPFVLWGLNYSLASAENFDALHTYFSQPFLKFILWGSLAAFIYHFIAGLRHLLMDVGIGVTLKSGRLGAWFTIVFSLILIVLAGIWLW